MKKSVALWPEIVMNPSTGFAQVGKETKIALPVILLLISILVTIALMLPMMLSDPYAEALARVQLSVLAERGTQLSEEQSAAMAQQLRSPAVRGITVASALVVGTITYVLMLLFSTLVLKIVAAAAKQEEAGFGVLFKVMVYSGVFGVVQRLAKDVVIMTGNWERALRKVGDTDGLKEVLQAPLSAAMFFDHETLGDAGFYVLDAVTDPFNWLTFIFVYFGVRYAAEMTKGSAFAAVVLSAAVYVGVGLGMSMLA
jgi:hypothetical protein